MIQTLHPRIGLREKRVVPAGVIGRCRTQKTRCHLYTDDNVFLGGVIFLVETKTQISENCR